MSLALELHELQPEDRYRSPYARGVPGYLHDAWWTHLDFALDDPNAHFLVITDGEEEVARALVLEHRIATSFVDFDARVPTIEIDKFAVRQHLWLNGHGRSAVDLIRRRWASFQTVAFSLDADHFWRKIGFTERRRVDGGSGYKPFYVAPRLE